MKRVRHHQEMRDWSLTLRDRALTGAFIAGVIMITCIILASV